VGLAATAAARLLALRFSLATPIVDAGAILASNTMVAAPGRPAIAGFGQPVDPRPASHARTHARTHARH